MKEFYQMEESKDLNKQSVKINFEYQFNARSHLVTIDNNETKETDHLKIINLKMVIFFLKLHPGHIPVHSKPYTSST